MDKAAEVLKICEEGIKNSFSHLRWGDPAKSPGPYWHKEIKVVPLEFLEKIRDILQKKDSCATEF